MKMTLVSCAALAVLAGSAMAQVTLSNNYTSTTIASWTNTLDGTAPTFNRPLANGIGVPSTGLSGSGTAVRYGTQSFSTGSGGLFTVANSWARAGATGGEGQFIYGSGGFAPGSPLTNNLSGAVYGAVATATAAPYNVSLPAGTATIVNCWTTNTASFGTFTTTVTQDPGALIDAVGTTNGVASFSVTSASTDLVQTLDSITIRGLTHTYIGDLQFRISNGATDVLFFVPASASDSRGVNGDYTFQFGAAGLPVGGTSIPAGTYGTTTDFTSAYAGAPLAGTWTLSIIDIGAGDTGRIAGFDLNFTTVPTPGAAALLGLGGLVAGRRRRN